jgi:hypothetical protein
MPSSHSAERPLQSRTVNLTGNYKIPLPSTLSTDDVRAIKDGVFAAGSIAKEITAALRGSHAPDAASVDGDTVAGTETPKTPGSWARLIEGASQLVQKAAQAIEVDAAVEATGSSAARAGGSGSASASQQAQTKWKKKTGVKTEGGASGKSSPTPMPEATGGSGSKGKGKMPAGLGRSTSWAGGSSAKAV